MTLPLPRSRSLGSSGLEVGPLAYGCWRFAGTDVATARAKIETALQLGMTLIDTADVYGVGPEQPFGSAEMLLGQVLAGAPSLRQQMVLATKGGIELGVPYNSSAAHILTACDDSLQRLGVERIDLYQIHRPDVLVHPEELASALVRLRDAGKIRAAGVSNYTAAQFDALQAFLPFPLVTHQSELSPLCIEPLGDGVLDQCLQKNVAFLAWSPLAGGRLLSDEPDTQPVRSKLGEVAMKRETTLVAVALAFLMAHPAAPIPILGSQQPDRMVQCAAALELRLTRGEWYEILTAARGEALP